MIILDPAQRPTVEDLKSDPWFEGIDWDAITYGPTVPRECFSCDMTTDPVLTDVPVYRFIHAVLRRCGRPSAVFHIGLVEQRVKV